MHRLYVFYFFLTMEIFQNDFCLILKLIIEEFLAKQSNKLL